MVRYKKVLLAMIVGVLCLGVISGCGKVSCDFHSTQEAQKYVLSKLKNKYHETFVFVEEPDYKEEKIGLNWISGKIVPEDDPEKIAFVYARNTGMFTDNYHVYDYADQIRELAVPLFAEKDYIKETCITVQGRRSDTAWTGKEPLEEYVEKGEYDIIADVYLYEDRTDEEYVEQICLLIGEISGCELNVQLDIWDKSDEWIFRAFPDDGELVKDREYILEQIHSHRSLRESMDDYEEWKKQMEVEGSKEK